MSDRYAFNTALNQEAALILVAAGHTPACQPGGHIVRIGFQMGLSPDTSPDNPQVRVMFLYPQLLTDEEVERAEESPEAREQVLTELAQRIDRARRELVPAYAETLRQAGWDVEEAWPSASVVAVPPAAVVEAAAATV